MNRNIVFLVSALGLILFTKPLHAGLKVSNQTNEVIAVAIGYIDNNVAVSKGWFILQPREIKTIITGHLPDRQYYYYFTSSSPTVWSGTDPFFISSSPDFTIQGNNLGSIKGVKLIQFKKASTANDGDDRTIIIAPAPPRTAAILQPKAPRGTHQTKGAQIRDKNN